MEITMTFEWDGKTVHKDVKGAKGKGCIKATKFLEEDLGTAGERHLKAEFYHAEKQESNNQNKLRL